MGEIKSFDLIDLGGGHNDGLPATDILDREQANLVNFYPFGAKLVRRDGMRQITTSPYADIPTSLFAYKDSTGAWTLLMGAKTSFAKLSGTGIVQVPFTAGDTLNPITDPWVFKQYKDVAYAVRRSSGGLWRVTPDFAQAAGIPAGPSAPTLADGGAGNLDAGDYYGVVTGYNQFTGIEGNPSPVSVKLTIAINHDIAWSGIPIFNTPQVNARRLYRTLPNQQGEYYFVAQLNDNVTTTYNDNVIIANLGSQVSFANGLPPGNLQCAEVWEERLFVTDGTDIFFSEEGLPECFDTDSIISVFPDDGASILPIKAFGDRLIVGKTNAIHYIVGSDRSSFQVRTLSDRHGAGSRYGMASAEGLLFWYGNDDNVYRSDGNSVASISTVKVRAILDRVPAAQKGNVIAAVYPRYSWLLLSVPVDNFTTNRKVLVYNYRSDAWTIFEHPGDAPWFLADFFDSNQEQVLYATIGDGHVYQYSDPDAGGLDYGNPIVAKIRSKKFGFGQQGLMRGFKRIGLLCDQVSQNITLRAYKEGVAAALKSRTVSLDTPHDWKMYNFSTLGTPGSTMQLELEYSGAPVITMAGMRFDVGVFQRFMRAS